MSRRQKARRNAKRMHAIGMSIAVVALGIPCIAGLSFIGACLLFTASKAYGF